MATRFSKTDKTTISISLGTILKTVVLLLCLGILYLLRDLVLVILVSVVVASAVEPMAAWLQQKRLPRVPAVLLIYLLGFALIFVLVPIFVFPVVTDLISLSSTL